MKEVYFIQWWSEDGGSNFIDIFYNVELMLIKIADLMEDKKSFAVYTAKCQIDASTQR